MTYVTRARNFRRVWAAKAAPQPAASVNTNTAGTSVTLDWPDVAGASGYIVDYQLANGQWVQVYRGTASTFVHTRTHRYPARVGTLQYRIFAISSKGHLSTARTTSIAHT